jgi:MFS family permease
VENHRRQLYALSIFHAVNDGSLAVFLAGLPVMMVALNLSLIQIGTLLSAGLLATVIMQFVFGYLSDRGHTRPVLIAGLASVAVIDIVFVEAGRYWHVFLFYVLLRAAAGVYHPVSFSTIFRTTQNRSAAMGFQSAFGDASLAFAMFSTGFIAESLGWRVPFLLWGLVGLMGVVAFVSLLRSHHEASAVDEFPEKSVERARNHGISKHFVVLQFSTMFLQCLFLIFTGFMPLFLNINFKLSPGISSLVVALWLALGVGSGFNAGRFVKFFGSEQRTIKISFGLTTLMLIAATALTLKAELWAATLVLLVLTGIPYFLSFPVLYGIVGTTAPGNRLGLAYATNLSLSLVAGSALSYGTGYLSSIRL